MATLAHVSSSSLARSVASVRHHGAGPAPPSLLGCDIRDARWMQELALGVERTKGRSVSSFESGTSNPECVCQRPRYTSQWLLTFARCACLVVTNRQAFWPVMLAVADRY
jgi:hypothetical protein